MATIIGPDGGSGDDLLKDLPGDDTLLGGAGNDTLLGQEFTGFGESNLFDGGAGDDVINAAFAASGSTLIGGTGDDDLYGSAFGPDRLVFGFAFETTAGGGGGPVTRNFFEDTGTLGKTDWTQSELVRTYSAWLREHFGDAAAEAWKQNDRRDALHLEDVENTTAKVVVATGAKTKDRWIADTVTAEGASEGPGSATLTGHDGTDDVFGFGAGDTLVLNGFAAFDADAGTSGVQIVDAGLALLSTVMSLAVDFLDSNDQADTRLSWDGGSITLWDVALGSDGDLGSFLQSGQVQLLA